MRRPPPILAGALFAVCAATAVGASPAAVDVDRTLEFAGEMAERGNWREARFRWSAVVEQEGDDPRLLNNLAVAAEALGESEEALKLYARARGLAPDDPWIAGNASAAERLRALVAGEGPEGVGGWGDGAFVEASRKDKKRAKVLELPVRLPLPPKLRLAGMKTLLVASFLVEETDLLDLDREIVRFLRSEFRKRSSLEVADVPPPPVPEQTLEDMIRNNGFWKYLGKEYGADIVVSGVLRFDRRDASGFRETDIVNPTTGQKQKTTRFVEQQEFRFEMDVLFFRGLDGSLLYRDKFRRESVYAGTANDPISAFYDLAGRTTEDVSAVVSPAYRTDLRAVFAP
jgi:hypothetical protein